MEDDVVVHVNNNRNANLRHAIENRDDEFYTCYDEIEKELNRYAQYFRDKVIYCNCDDHAGIRLGTPKSNFLKYFADNFEAFGIKKVIATHYEREGSSTMYILDKDKTGDGVICSEDIEEIPLSGNGDFRSDECIELLKQADIVITNPPFSLFPEYIAQLIEYEKKFIIIGNKNALSYRSIFPLIKENKVWLGYSSPCNFIYDGVPTKKVNGLTRWFTNLPTTRRNEKIETGRRYYGFESDYPKYYNYDAINIGRTSDIPMDYDGVMGVPITFIDKYNPEQFEIIGLGISNSGLEAGVKPYKPEHKNYRIHVQHKGAVDGDLYMIINGVVTVPFARILIRKKKGQ